MPDESYVDLDGAVEALKAMGLESDETDEPSLEQAPEPKADAESAPDEITPEEEPEVEAEAPAEETPEEDFIPRADLESLLEGVEDETARERIVSAYKSFQSGFTKRNQEISEVRRAFEDIDPTEARQAYDFVQRLGSDSQFAMQIHSELSNALEAAGMSPRAAAQEASRQIDEKASEVDDLSEFEDNPFVQQLNELKAWKAEQERAQAEYREFAEQREKEETAIRAIETQAANLQRTNPSLDQDDMDAIYKIAAATGGDLDVAFEYYGALRDRLVTDYVATKKRVPAGAGSPPGGGAIHSEEPIEIRTTGDAHKHALDRVKQLFAAE